jgi:hypothetical protein
MPAMGELGSSSAAGLTVLLGDSSTGDVVDAFVALAARPGDQVLTGDPTDIAALLAARRVVATVVRV